jgi:hypothetical protein
LWPRPASKPEPGNSNIRRRFALLILDFEGASMDNLSNQIGALEFGDHPAFLDDGALEAAMTHPEPVTRGAGCGVPPTIIRISCVSDNALEAVAGKAVFNPTPATSPASGCPLTIQVVCHSHVGDDALEAVGASVALSPTTHGCVPATVVCR